MRSMLALFTLLTVNISMKRVKRSFVLCQSNLMNMHKKHCLLQQQPLKHSIFPTFLKMLRLGKLQNMYRLGGMCERFTSRVCILLSGAYFRVRYRDPVLASPRITSLLQAGSTSFEKFYRRANSTN